MNTRRRDTKPAGDPAPPPPNPAEKDMTPDGSPGPEITTEVNEDPTVDVTSNAGPEDTATPETPGPLAAEEPAAPEPAPDKVEALKGADPTGAPNPYDKVYAVAAEESKQVAAQREQPGYANTRKIRRD